MAVNFPDNPNNGDTTVVNGVTYTYNSTNNLWKAGSSSSSGGGSGTTAYATAAELPQTATNGDLALVEETDKLYIWNDTAWYNIALINTAPSITQGGAGSYTLATDGTPTVITLTATDPESVPVTWSYAVTSGSLTNGGGVTATVTQADNVFTITPTTTTAYAGTFTLTFSVTDGANIVNDVNSFSLNFITVIENSKYTTALITTNGTSGTNTNIVDSSSNAFAITLNGTPQLQTFSPYRSGGYSMYFDSTYSQYLRIGYNTAFNYNSSTPFTIDMWFNPNVADTDNAHIASSNTGTGDNNLNWLFRQKADNTLRFVMLQSDGTVVVCDSTDSMNFREWNHVAVVMTGTSIKHWLNGVFQREVSFDGTPQVNGQIDIGAWGTTYYTGYISDFRYNVNEQVYTGTADITVPTERLTANAYTQLLACHLPYLADGSTNSRTITPFNVPKVAPLTQFDHDEFNSTDHGGSIYFEDGDYIISTDDSSLDVSGAYTAEAWIYVDTFPSGNIGNAGQGFVMARWTASGDQRSWGIFLGNNGAISLYHSATGSSSYQIANALAGTITGSMWHHVAATWDGTTMRLFVDGTLAAFAADSNGPYSTPNAGVTLNSLNVSLTGTGIKQYISDARYIPNQALYTADFTPPPAPLVSTNTAIHIKGTGADIIDKNQSVGAFTLVGNTTASLAQTKYAGASILFNGTTDYMTIPADNLFNFGTDDFTIECWIYYNSTPPAGSGYDYIWAFGDNNANGFGLYIWGGEPRIWNATNIFTTTNGAGSISSGQWYHLAFTRQNGTAKLWQDGVEIGSVANSNSLSGGLTSGVNLGRWSNINDGQYFDGYIEDFRVTKSLARYTANFTPPTGSLEG